ncbi:MAG: sensor histidine kinase [Gammaproteobacteria bacterium]|nr:sensor histidine kinase [Gammaproteobacteria bacterium]
MATTTHELTNELIATRESERRRIASELHDGIGQRLCALKFRLEVNLKASNEGGQSQILEAAIQNIQETLAELHRIALDLRPLGLSDDAGILGKLDILCQEFLHSHPDIRLTKRYGVDEGDIPLTLKVVVYRIIQEAFNNIAKHAAANQVSVGIQKTDAGMWLEITDNGAGFNVQEHTGPTVERLGLGLESMSERAAATGGGLTIRSRRGNGTSIEAHWPTSAIAHLAGN